MGARAALKASILLVALTLLAACQGSDGSTSSGSPERGGTLKVALGADIVTLIPYEAADTPSITVITQIYDTLFTPTADGSVEPGLASSIKVSGDRQTVSLEPDVTFSDGTPVRPVDVVFSLQQAMASPSFSQIYSAIESVRPEGQDSVVITTKSPVADLSATLSNGSAAIVPASWGGRSKEEFGKAPVGSGPFMLEGRKAGQSVTLERNPNFRGSDQPYVDGVEFQVFADGNAMSTAFKSGSVDLAPSAPLASVPSFGTAAVVTYVTPSTGTESIFINGRSGPLSSLDVRKAISLAIDRGALVDGLLEGHGTATGTLIPPAVASGAEPAPVPEQDTDEAARLLEEAGYGDGFAVDMTYVDGNASEAAAAQVIQESLAAVGITVNVRSLDQGTWVTQTLAGDYDLALFGLSSNGTSPVPVLGFYVSTKGYGGGWPTAEAEKAILEFGKAQGGSAQQNALEGFQEWVSSELPIVALYHPEEVVIASHRAGGVDSLSAYDYPLESVWITD